MPKPDRIVVVGASLAGVRAAEELRRLGFDGDLAVVGAESHLPYDRPPLSKQVLAGTWEPDKTRLRVDPAVSDSLRLGVRATRLDTAEHVVELDTGERLPFDGLVIATGAAPRSLPGTEGMEGAFVLRTLDDCTALRHALDRQPKVAVIGAGFIGSEVAASCRARGLETTVIEALDLPLIRILGPTMGEVCAAVHRDHGTSLKLGVGVQGLEGGKRVQRVRLADGTAVEADVVVVGIGVAPVVDWLEGSGLVLDNGVLCDSTLRAEGVPDGSVVAAGDVARWFHPGFDEVMRIEHWTNAAEQGAYAAASLLGMEDGPFAAVPYFWSDQYDVKIQFVGRATAADELTVEEGSLEERRFVAAYRRGDRLVGALSMNMPARIMAWRANVAAEADSVR
jgi:NADPH-dependent 2,4-dienoyl-CoA reductase/sulfur reductase-like enzyme